MSRPGEPESGERVPLSGEDVEIDREAEPDRYRCPRGHVDWALGYGGMVHCWTCEDRRLACNYGTVRDAIRHVRIPADRLAVVGGKRWLSERWSSERRAQER